MQHTANITEQRVRALLDAYGSDPVAWPPEERDAALAILAQSPGLQAQQAQAARLDNLIGHERNLAALDDADTQALQACILEGLPDKPSHRGDSIWRNLLGSLVPPRLAFALATFTIVATAVYLQIPDADLPAARGEFEQWAWYDITGQELNTTTELSMLDFLELEITEGDS